MYALEVVTWRTWKAEVNYQIADGMGQNLQIPFPLGILEEYNTISSTGIQVLCNATFGVKIRVVIAMNFLETEIESRGECEGEECGSKGGKAGKQ